MYNCLKTGTEENIIFKWLWKGACRVIHKIYFWLLLHEGVNTRNLLKGKSMHLDCYECVFSNEGAEETLMHLFWDCTFAQDCWDTIFTHRHRGTSAYDEIFLACHRLPKSIAMDIIILGCWNIWIQRNGKLFRREVQSQITWKFMLKQDLTLLKHRISKRI